MKLLIIIIIIIAVRAGKRIIYDSCSSHGSLNNDKTARAIMQYRNTQLPDINLSPAQILLHRNIRDGLPAHPDHYIPHKEWVITAEERDLAYARRNEIIKQKYDKRARNLPVLSVGDSVVVQNQRTGKKWDRLGRIVEVLPHRQYRIRMIPSGRITLINRRFIRPYTIAKPTQMRPTGPIIQTDNGNTELHISSPPNSPASAVTPPTTNIDHGQAAPAPTPDPAPAPTVPRALRKLLDFNNPGPKWTAENPGGRR